MKILHKKQHIVYNKCIALKIIELLRSERTKNMNTITEKTIIATDKAPEALGPYVQAVKAGNLLFASGQLGLIPETGKLAEGVEAQTRQSLLNLTAVLTEAGYSISDVVKTTVYVDDMNDFARVNAVYEEFFNEWKPARSCVEVGKLPKDALVEMDIIAAK